VELLETLLVKAGVHERRICLYHGDLACIPAEEAVDLLIVSASPGDYLPTPTSLIGALQRAGVSVAELSRNKAEDLREQYGCWLSAPLSPRDSSGFRQILCFEPASRGRPPEVVGDVFRCLAEVLGQNPTQSIAMPLVASGDQRWRREEMFAPLINAAIHWLELGLPIDTIKIVERERDKAELLARELSDLKEKLYGPQLTRTDGFVYEVFLSYARQDRPAAEFLGSQLRKQAGAPRVFEDTLSIDAGSAWQQEIWNALEACRRVVVLYSPAYLNSKVCQEEYQIARLRDREEGGVLAPIYLVSATLPAHMRVFNYIDCREANFERLSTTVSSILA
jgi:TIR domain